MTMAVIHSFAVSLGYVTLFGTAFWVLCIGLSYARIGIKKLLARRKPDPFEVEVERLMKDLDKARESIDGLRKNDTTEDHRNTN